MALTLLVLDLGLHVVNGVRGLHLQRDGLAGQRLHEDLHAAAQAQHQVQGGLLLDVVVGQGAPVLQLLAGEDEALLVGRDALLVLRSAGFRSRRAPLKPVTSFMMGDVVGGRGGVTSWHGHLDF